MSWVPEQDSAMVEAMFSGGPTAPLSEFVAAYERDDNIWWVVGCGHHQNLFDAAIEEIERLRGCGHWQCAIAADREEDQCSSE